MSGSKDAVSNLDALFEIVVSEISDTGASSSTPAPSHINFDSVSAGRLREKLNKFHPSSLKYYPPYRRTIITHSGQVPNEDSEIAFDCLIGSLRLREKYMERSLQQFSKITAKYINCFDGEITFEQLTDTLITRMNRERKFSTCEDCSNKPTPHVSDPWNITFPEDSGHTFKIVQGIIQVFDNSGKQVHYKYPTFEEHVKDLNAVHSVLSNGPVRTFSEKRLNVLRSKFDIHTNLNQTFELSTMQEVPHRDFYNVLKVDTHIHAAGAMNVKTLLQEISDVFDEDPNVPAVPGKNPGDPPLTLAQLFQKLQIKHHELSVDMLDVQTDNDAMNRFDVFNSKYNPMGDSALRKLFLKSSNLNKGKYFANILKTYIGSIEKNGYIYSELRNGAGNNIKDWTEKSKWVIDNELYSNHVRWGIQVARTYDSDRKSDKVKSFQEFLEGIYLPMFLASSNPNGHLEIAKYLHYCWGFDSVDDESKPEVSLLTNELDTPDEWTLEDNPPYAYYLYYMHANLCILNQFRKERGLNLFTLRPHSGESGSIVHLASSFLLAENISHGIELRENPAMEYLFYLAQIPIAMSPLSNNALFLPYIKNPLKHFFAEGIPITVSTDDPLMFHMTLEPLLEEYAIAKQVFHLSTCDVCEMARNSVLMSGFPDNVKRYFIGETYAVSGIGGNDIGKTNVPNVRIAYRTETLMAEMLNVCIGSSYHNKIHRHKTE